MPLAGGRVTRGHEGVGCDGCPLLTGKGAIFKLKKQGFSLRTFIAKKLLVAGNQDVRGSMYPPGDSGGLKMRNTCGIESLAWGSTP